jgi:hypothetical protein
VLAEVAVLDDQGEDGVGVLAVEGVADLGEVPEAGRDRLLSVDGHRASLFPRPST